jgi:cyclic beta-1,2-glucan synthetase
MRTIEKIRQARTSRPKRPGSNDTPLRAELFSVEQLARHARWLAAGHKTATHYGANELLARLDANERKLRAFNHASRGGNADIRITPAAEWLLDNFYLIEEQIQMARRHLPRTYSRELPILDHGAAAGLPRVYEIVSELISHLDAQVDAEPLSAFIDAYQTVDPLKLGELWAIPIMLRLGLIENLQRIATRLLAAGKDRDHADVWVERLRGMADKSPSHLVVVVADMAKSNPPVSSAFVAQFTEQLSRQSPVLHLARGWLEQYLLEQGLSIEQLVHQESQNQAADQISVSHSIGSLRFLGSMDWKEFVETLSLVEETLRSDPSGIYRKMDFATRDTYRHAVETIARHGRMSEFEVALESVRIAAENARKHGTGERAAHVGFHLVDKGLPALARAAGTRWPLAAAIEGIIRRFPLAYYAGGAVLLTLAFAFAFHQLLAGTDVLGLWSVALILLFLVCASQPALTLVNWFTSMLAKPRALPRLDFSHGIAPGYRTMVVVPTMLASPESVQSLISKLEIHYLSNRDPHLYFALLTDFLDAAQETMPDDDALLLVAREGVDDLNHRYAPDAKPLFFLFHRPRLWNPGLGLWMGYERKRGKLAAFNSLLRGGPEDRFSSIVGDTATLQSVRYVITLDTDTVLPRDAARRLVATMAHPLNKPEFDPVREIVTVGHGIMQPRVGVSLPGARRSWYVRLFAGDAGIDPYTREVSDLYQDVFCEGSFIGKGIYDVDAFERAMHGRFPENIILSHDLLEGCHARAALVSDVEFYEEHPSSYMVDAARRHRWIRGDWQIARWLLPRVAGPDGVRVRNPLSLLSRWKLCDNLRRSLFPIALMLLATAVWLLLPEHCLLGLLLVPVIIALPTALASAAGIVRKPAEMPWRLHLNGQVAHCGRQAGQVALVIAFLPHDAWLSLDAIMRTLYRLMISHKRLLEWQTSSETEKTTVTHLAGMYAAMWSAPAAALGVAAFLWQVGSPQLPWVSPILAAWGAAPWISWWISRTHAPATPNLTENQRVFLRRTARKTWSFFETFVTEEENWLPPDNFQEIPVPVIASRTSPTNMGMALLSNLAARDFGYLTTGGLIQRTRDTLDTMRRMDRDRGHFYNWYDTRTLQPLHPVYISSVDSGNLAGHLLTLGAGLRGLADEPVCPAGVLEGPRDTAAVLADLTGSNAQLAQIEAQLRQTPVTQGIVHDILETATRLAARLAETLQNGEGAAAGWGLKLKHGCERHLQEIEFLMPWLASPTAGAPIPQLARLEIKARVQHLPNGDAAAIMEQQLARLENFPTLREISELDDSTTGLTRELAEARERARHRITELEELAACCDEMAAMDFTFLYDHARDLFITGFNVSEVRNDSGYYDLLASEARLCSYVAIALGQVPQDHWFSMSRLLVAAHSEPVLVSWSGSMFEYLMPLLVMPTYDNTLLDHSCRTSVKQQIEYGKARDVPWGISESAYNRTDLRMNYQYRAFGVPGLGLKRGLAEDLVIAPYATVMALMIAPRRACENLLRLAADGREGDYGFYEAVDYTPSRVPPDETSATVRSYMAHHQGMSLLALLDVLHDHPMQKRFMACPRLKAADLLLQERVPKTVAGVFTEALGIDATRDLQTESEAAVRVCANPTPLVPEINLLSNGNYHVAISSAGGGYSRWRDLALTRWREDSTRDDWGMFVYLRDVTSGDFWSAAFQPTCHEINNYEAVFSQSRTEFRQRQAGFDMHTEICVSPEDDVEVRRITLTNRRSTRREIELTSYAEVVLAPPAAEAAHPAFSNLSVQTEFEEGSSAILCTRRARSAEERPPWLLHLMTGQGGGHGKVSCETDRSKFLGRGGSPSAPAAMTRGTGPLSNTTGPVLDPVISLRRTITLAPYETAVVNIIMGVTETRDAALSLIDQYQGTRRAERAFDLAWTHSQVTLHHIGVTPAEARLYGKLAGALIYADPARRADPSVLRNNRRGQSGLWSHGISGDSPLVLLRISDPSKLEIVRQVVRAHSYWRMKGLTVELMILNEDESIYRQALQDDITSLISSGIEAQMLDQRGGIFVRRIEQVPQEDLILLQAVARIILDDEKGTLTQQTARVGRRVPAVPAFAATAKRSVDIPAALADRNLAHENGYGGFTRDGHEYVITLEPGVSTPAPWVNVIASPFFGTVVSESGSAYTWIENAHEFRLTPWSNDPVRDTSGEAFYLRDEQTGQYWSPTPSPARGVTPYVIRHGFGYTVFEHTENGIHTELWIYVAMDAPVKFAVLKTRNVSGRPRRLSATGYWEWVLGDLREKSLMHVQTELDIKTNALLALNAYNHDFLGRITFVDVNDSTRTLTGDRREFIGRNGTLAHPAAMKSARLSGTTGPGLDPCAAIQVTFDLQNGQERETVFRLGCGRDRKDVADLLQRFRKVDAARTALEGVWEYWNRTLGAVNVDTPDPSVNMMANGWLLYQTLGCRVWGRSGFYQSGGAFGFRDQLQDVMALVHAEPAVARKHILLAASRQFREGDVQHWWHPPAGRGVRTHFSDDYLWLPFVVCRYVSTVADTGVLDEMVPFLEGRTLRPDEEAYYDLPNRSEEEASLYQHCVRSIENGLKFGEHGLPLIGCGDWNDGMNLVGKDGRGESVWLAFFLYDVLTRFAPLARARGDHDFAERCLAHARDLQRNIEENAWDGEWYRRAWFDNGEPLGSHSNQECQIDSLPQSWSVISGAGDPSRSRQAMESVDQRLVRRDAGLIQLFDPPFDKSPLNPGYIKAYIPGVRENGGQYTHAAIWTAMAFAAMGKNERAWELFTLLNPVHHGGTPEEIATYKVEPYVVAADVYAVAPHTGRGGWTWYTGSASWMYRLLVETLLGVHLEGNQLRLDPRLPDAWDSYKIHYRYRQTVYHITISRFPDVTAESNLLTLDGTELPGVLLPLHDDHQEHHAELKLRAGSRV